MLNGPLYQEEDGNGSGSPGDAASDAADSFPDSPPAATTSCTPSPGPGSGSGGPAWTAKDIKSNLDTCDGGTNVWSKAKTANGGKDPVIQEGSSVIGSGASVDTDAGVITIDPGKSKCEATQYAVQELTNQSHKADFGPARDCGGGTMSREDYIRGNEKIEYDGVHNVNTAFQACKAKWGCADTATSVMDWAKSAKDFDDYYKNYLGQNHKDYYGNLWDKDCKAAWDKKNPPPAAAPAKAPGSKAPAPSGDNSGGSDNGGANGTDDADDSDDSST